MRCREAAQGVVEVVESTQRVIDKTKQNIQILRRVAADLVEHLKSYDHEKGTKWNTERQTKKMTTLVQENLWYFSDAESGFEAMEEDLKLNMDQINAIGEEMSEMVATKRRRTDSAATDASTSFAARPKKDNRIGVQTSKPSFSSGWQNSGTRNTTTAPWSKGWGKKGSR